MLGGSAMYLELKKAATLSTNSSAGHPKTRTTRSWCSAVNVEPVLPVVMPVTMRRREKVSEVDLIGGHADHPNNRPSAAQRGSAFKIISAPSRLSKAWLLLDGRVRLLADGARVAEGPVDGHGDWSRSGRQREVRGNIVVTESVAVDRARQQRFVAHRRD